MKRERIDNVIELLDEVRRFVNVYELQVERQKTRPEYPYSEECDHLYRRIISRSSLNAWRQCEQLFEKYMVTRMIPIKEKKSENFDKRIKAELEIYPGKLTERTKWEIIEYMKKLEWRVEELENKDAF